MKIFISKFEKDGKIQVITFYGLGDWNEKEMDDLWNAVYCNCYMGKCLYCW